MGGFKKKKRKNTRMSSRRVCPHRVYPHDRRPSRGCRICIVSGMRAGRRLLPFLLPLPLRRICQSSTASGRLGWDREDRMGKIGIS